MNGSTYSWKAYLTDRSDRPQNPGVTRHTPSPAYIPKRPRCHGIDRPTLMGRTLSPAYLRDRSQVSWDTFIHQRTPETVPRSQVSWDTFIHQRTSETVPGMLSDTAAPARSISSSFSSSSISASAHFFPESCDNKPCYKSYTPTAAVTCTASAVADALTKLRYFCPMFCKFVDCCLLLS